MCLPPGNWSSQRHWHSHEDEFVYVLEGELMLVEDDGETLLRAGDCAAFPKSTGNGHHLINRSGATAIYLEAGSRQPADVTTCSDIDMMSTNADGRFVHKDGTPYFELEARGSELPVASVAPPPSPTSVRVSCLPLRSCASMRDRSTSKRATPPGPSGSRLVIGT